MKVFPLLAVTEDRSCSFQLDKYDLGLSAAKFAPFCQTSDATLWEEKQCGDMTCTCVDTVTGLPSDPPRYARAVDKAKLKCSGTPCLDELAKNSKLAAEWIEEGIVDLPFIPICTTTGYYHAVQSDPNLGIFCTGPFGEYKSPIEEEVVNSVSFCQDYYVEWRKTQG